MQRGFRSPDASGHGTASPPRWHPARIAVWAGAVLMVSVALLMVSPRVDAKQKFMSLFGQAYPEAAGTPLDSCLLCHTNASNPSEDNLNRYGEDWEDGDIGDKRFLAPRLVQRDSDGDGVPNGQEIGQLSFPGSASSSTPPTTTTTVPGTPIDGSALFASRCAACHGSGGGDLSGTGLGRATFTSVTLNGQGSMPAQAGLTSDEAGAIWDFVTGVPTATTTTTTTLPGVTTTTTAPKSGSAVWAESCAACHGASGGNVVPTSLSRSQLIAVVTHGVGSMRGFPELGSVQIANVADYLQGFSVATTTMPGATTTTTVPRSGAAVWAESCAACHGASGGNLRDNSLSLSEIVSATTNGIGSMPAYASRLSSSEISNVARYVYSVGTGSGVTTTATTVPPDTVGVGATLYLQNCSACHGIHGEGGSGGSIAATLLTRGETIEVISSGIGSMPGYESMLSSEDIGAIADHIAGMTTGTESTTTTATGGDGDDPVAPQSSTTVTETTIARSADGGPAQTMGAPPLDQDGGSLALAIAVGMAAIGALGLWGRSLRKLTQWSGGD